MERLRRAGLLIAILAGSLSAPAEEVGIRPLAERILERIEAAREEAGAPAWTREVALDDLARDLAKRRSRDPRASFQASLRHYMDEEAAGHYARLASPFVQVYRMADGDPADAALRRWRDYPTAWQKILDPSLDTVGIADTLTDDGAYVVVLVAAESAFEPPSAASMEKEAARRINEIRRGQQLPELEFHETLHRVARDHSRDMARRDYFAHRSPEGTAVSDRVLATGYVYSIVGENIHQVRGSRDPVASAVDGWMGSRSHRENILLPAYRESGIGVAVGKDGMIYFTQVFAAPRK